MSANSVRDGAQLVEVPGHGSQELLCDTGQMWANQQEEIARTAGGIARTAGGLRQDGRRTSPGRQEEEKEILGRGRRGSQSRINRLLANVCGGLVREIYRPRAEVN